MRDSREIREKGLALGISLVAHVAVVLLLLLLFLRPTPREEEGGILVNIGDVDFASGMFVPHQLEPDYQPATPPLPPPATTVEDPLLTQDTPEAPAIEQKRVEQKQRADEERRHEAERRRQEEQRRQKELAEQRRKEQIRQRVSGAFGSGTAQQGSGNTVGADPGQEGSPDGNVATGGVNTGVGGFGSFALGGRRLVSGGLPRPSYSAQVEGTIVVEITVSPEGKVINTSIAPGTNIDNSQMLQSALSAAKKARFNPVEGLNNQVGTITYRYRLN